MRSNHPHMAAIAAGLVPAAGTAAFRPGVIHGFEIDGMPPALALGLHKVVQASDSADALTLNCERLSSLACARAPDPRAHVG
jgi:hypothetical protein